MKKLLVTLLSLTCLSSVALADTYVRGYYRNDGTYVAPHYRSSPNHTKSDNWSTRGNVNPYTGEAGTRTYDNYNNSRGYGSSYGNSYGNTYGNQRSPQYEGFRY